jgi:hypothetical protein
LSADGAVELLQLDIDRDLRLVAERPVAVSRGSV